MEGACPAVKPQTSLRSIRRESRFTVYGCEPRADIDMIVLVARRY